MQGRRSMEACNKLNLSTHTLNNTIGKGTYEGSLSKEGSTLLLFFGVSIVGAKAG